jgi:hypothetical protein
MVEGLRERGLGGFGRDAAKSFEGGEFSVEGAL